MRRTYWMGSSRDDVREFPDAVKREVGYAIHLAQLGDKATFVMPLAGFGSSKVLEVIVNDDGDTYRAVYTVKFKEAVYVLHAFQKKSKRGIATPKHDIDLIKRRLGVAASDYEARHGKERNRAAPREKRNDQSA